MSDVDFRFAARSDVGLVRKQNQDSGYAGHHLLVVADGMGGPAGGDIASSVVVGELAPLDEELAAADQLLGRLRMALYDSHENLLERSSDDPALRGLGTTCVAIYRSGNKLGMVHVGDSRGYLLRDGQLVQVTRDHSLVQYLVDTGQITPEEAEHHPKRSVILRVIGDTSQTVQADETVREAVVGDRWLLCSDGLHGVVSAETLQEVLTTYADPEECADKLVELALLAGAPDNVTCVIGDVVEAGTEPQASPQIVGAAAKNRHIPTRGSGGAAGKAAELLQDSSEVGEADAEEGEAGSPKSRKRRWWPIPVVLVVLLAIGGGIFGWQWSQSQYYAQAVDGRVVVFQGIPQSLGPISFSHQVEETDLLVEDLAPVDQQRLQSPVIRDSLAQVHNYLQAVQVRANYLLENTDDGEDAQSGAESSTEDG